MFETGGQDEHIVGVEDMLMLALVNGHVAVNHMNRHRSTRVMVGRWPPAAKGNKRESKRW